MLVAWAFKKSYFGMDFAQIGAILVGEGKNLRNLAVLGGVVAVPCYSQSAIARRNSFPRIALGEPLLS